MAAPDASGEWITLAVVIKTQGRHGRSSDGIAHRRSGPLSAGHAAVGADERRQRREVTVEDLWPHKSFLVLKFQGIETIPMPSRWSAPNFSFRASERACWSRAGRT
jgi:hypothetical protein